MKKYAFKGFIIFLVSSLVLNLSLMSFLNKKAETLALDLFHFIPTLFFNELMESIVAPSFFDVLFLFPIAVTDGLIGFLIGLFVGKIIRNKGKGGERFFFILTLILFAVFQFIIINFVPLFSS